MDIFEIDNTRKHYIPQMYLRGFSLPNNPKQIFMFDKQNPEMGVQVRSIHDVEVDRNAYSVEKDKILARRESIWSQILTEIRDSDTPELNSHIADREESANLRAWLARFVVDSRIRSRPYRDRVWNELAGTRRTIRERTERKIEEVIQEHPESERELRYLVSILNDVTHIGHDKRHAAIILDPFLRDEEGQSEYRLYEEGSWRFFSAFGDRKFITSDIPSASYRLGDEPQFRNRMWFHMPISADLRLIGLLGDARTESGLAPTVRELSERDMDLANACVFQNAERFIYSPSEREIVRANQHEI